jgi:cathepsin A (carboxypeptidase C)
MANLLYVDQPPGTGFSDGTMDKDEAGVAEDMYNFLQAFFTGFPQYSTSFFVFGESYAGHYVPAITHRIFVGNNAHTGLNIPLVGLGIGNGLTDPEVQYQYYADMAYNSTTAPSVISKSTYTTMKAAIPTCVKAIKSCQSSSSACTLAYTICNLAEVSPVQQTGINPYDLIIPCSYGNLCYNFTNVDAYLNRADVQQQLGVSKTWESCNMDVNRMFEGDWMKNFQTQIPDMLGAGIRVLIYAGDQDFICNWLGNKAWTLQMSWSGQQAFTQAPDQTWNVGGSPAGKIRTAQNFTFLQVFGGGHMVPMDQPVSALAMLDGFLSNTLPTAH